MYQPVSEEPSERRTGALARLAEDQSSRKRFLKLMGGGVGAASALSIFLAACGGSDSGGSATTVGAAAGTSTMATGGDVDIVNYALTLEYLEADYFLGVPGTDGPELELTYNLETPEGG